MTFKEIQDVVKNKIDELDQDDQIDVIIKDAINYSYTTDLARLDKRLTTAYVPVVNGLATLPDDIDTIEKITPVLLTTERRVGNVIMSDRDVTFSVVYSYTREKLVNDNDTLDISDKFAKIINLYACGVYFDYRKKNAMSQQYFNEYENAKMSLIDQDSSEEVVLNDYEIGDDYDE